MHWTGTRANPHTSRRICGGRTLAALALAGFAWGSWGAQDSAEFGGLCAMGLAEGRNVETDCSVTWDGPQNRRFCFSSADARASFLKDPEVHLRRALDYAAVSDATRTGTLMQRFKGEEVKAFVQEWVDKASQPSGGIYRFHDSASGKDLELVFEKIDFMRTLHGYGYFPELVFHAREDEGKKYLIDFWVKPQSGGGLRLMDTRIYKAPKREGETWKLATRMPKPWWWIPASEHPGEVEDKRGWEVMSAVDEHILAERARQQGVFQLKDEQTGQLVDLELVGIHQPVRRLQENGRYFACTDFRRAGSTDEIYDVDFWLEEKEGAVRVQSVRMHKVPVLEDGSWVQVPRYSFDDLKFDVVP